MVFIFSGLVMSAMVLQCLQSLIELFCDGFN